MASIAITTCGSQDRQSRPADLLTRLITGMLVGDRLAMCIMNRVRGIQFPSTSAGPAVCLFNWYASDASTLPALQRSLSQSDRNCNEGLPRQTLLPLHILRSRLRPRQGPQRPPLPPCDQLRCEWHRRAASPPRKPERRVSTPSLSSMR